jgi:hypothetical protein
MTGRWAILLVLLSSAARATIPCSVVVASTNRPVDPNIGLMTYKALVERLGADVLRKQMGITSANAQDGPALADMLVDALSLYDRDYCIAHPLGTLQDAIDALAAQVTH